MNSEFFTSEKVNVDNHLETASGRAPGAGIQPLVERIVASPGFRKSARLRDLLLYLAAHALSDPPQEVTETQIGLDVFQRRSFHPGEDSIVRVTTRQLRTRLEEYFRTEGRGERMVLEIPRGSYTPAIRERETAEAAEVSPPPVKVSPRGSQVNLALALVAVSALAVAGWLWRENRALRAGTPVPHTLVNDLLVVPGQRTVLVAADSGYFMVQKMTGRNATLAEYLDRSYLGQARAAVRDPRLLALLEHLGKASHTGIAEMNVFTRIIQQNPANASIDVRHARDMALRNFKQDNFIILGAARANPWCELFEEKTAFRAEFDPQVGKVAIHNRDPRPGEPALWGADDSTHYTHVAVVPNLAGTGRVLLSSGTSMAAKEAGGDFITDPAVPARLARRFGVTDLHKLTAFEVVLQSRAVDGAPRGYEIVASRYR